MKKLVSVTFSGYHYIADWLLTQAKQRRVNVLDVAFRHRRNTAKRLSNILINSASSFTARGDMMGFKAFASSLKASWWGF